MSASSTLRVLGLIGTSAFALALPQACVVVDPNCEAAPSCGDDVEVEVCPTGETCYEAEECGTDILCMVVVEQCLAEPTCGPGQVQVAVCPNGVQCETVSACGSSVLCAPSGPCTTSADCGPFDFCDFSDGLCGAGVAGECVPRPEACTDGPAVCYCDGTASMPSDISCEGWMGRDFDSTGTACALGPTAFACAQYICDGGTDDFCRLTTDDTGGPPSASCSANPACDPSACACLTEEIAACGGTCVDGPNGPTITCPGG